MTNQQNNSYGDAIEPIAIIGMSCRFPGQVSSPEEFWDMLSQGRSGHCDVPASRFNADAFHHPDHDRKGAIQPKSGFFIEEDISLFDAPFFSITAKEAMGMDPMQRNLLEIAYECFENAGIPIDALKGTSTSVYTGVMTNDYELLSAADQFSLPLNAASGTSRAMLSNRISWFFDLHGPSLTLDTACSSSLYALHLACQSLLLNESTQALVTGVNLILHPNFVSQLSSMHMLSPDGISHTFDERANGYGRGEAVGAVLLKPLRKALEDGDVVRAVIRGSGANQDGKTPGITMPSREAQGGLIRETYRRAGLDMRETGYFEAHGTGTKIGDPIELSAIGSCFAPSRDASKPLYVGSAKTNVGHTEGMAGLTALIKTVLTLEHATLPPLVGFHTLNPKLLLSAWKIALPLETMRWSGKGLRRASVNCFGFGGSNAHVILDDAYHYLQSRGLEGRHYSLTDEECDGAGLVEGGVVVKVEGGEKEVEEREEWEGEYKLLPFSMQDQNGLKRLASRFSEHLSTYLNSPTINHELNLSNLAYTLYSHRTQFPFRSFCVSNSIQELASGGLKSLVSRHQKRASRANAVVFVFTGQGAQWALMGRELLSDPSFSASVARSQVFLSELGCDWDAAALLRDPGPRINTTEHCQPICTVLQVALVDMLAEWGVRPAATVGHSSGEIGAAYAAGGITHRDAIKIAYFRGYYCGQIQVRLKDRRGTMLAAGLTPAEAQTYIEQVAEGSVVIGCINSPTSVTLSGDVEAISYLEERIKWDGKFARKLRVEIAYHSSHMHSVSADFLESIGKVETKDKFEVPMFSSVTTQKLESPEILGAEYWITNMVSPVRFSEAVSSLLAYSVENLKTKRKTRVNWSAAVEIGPHEALKGPFNQCVAASETGKSNTLLYTSVVRRGERSDKSAKEAAGLLWSLGHSIDINKVNGVGEKEVKTLKSLPPYPWQHSKGFWHEPATLASSRLSKRPRTDLLGIAVDNQNIHEPRWKNFLRLSENPWMRDHAITGTILYPAAGMIIMAIEAALQMAENDDRVVRGVELHDIRFDRGLVIPDVDEAVQTSLSLRPHETLEEGWFHWTVYSIPPGGSWTKHCSGLLSLVYAESEEASSIAHWATETQKYSDIKSRANKIINPSAFYSQLETIGMGYGPTFTNMTSASAIEGSQLGHGTIVIPDTKATMHHQFEYPHVIHPATLDAIFHLVFVALFEGNPMQEAAIPVTVEKLYIAVDQPKGAGSEFIGFATATKLNDRDSSGSLVVSDIAWWDPKVLVTNMVVRKVSSPSSASSTSPVNKAPKRIAQLEWKEDVDLLSRAAAESLIEREAVLFESKGLSSPAAQAAVWLDRQCHKDAALRVLAIVDSIASVGTTVELLSLFGPAPGQSKRFDNCVVAVATEELLSLLEENERLQKLSIQFELIEVKEGEKVPSQSFNIVLANLGTKNEKALAHITSRLLPDGKLVALSTSKPDSESQSLKSWLTPHFNTLAYLTTPTSSLLITTHSSPPQPSPTPKITLIIHSTPSPSLLTLINNLTTLFSTHSITLESSPLSSAKTITTPVICLLEAEDALVMNWTPEEFSHFRELVFSQSYILWLTRGGILSCGEASLQFAPTTGLLRTMRVEVPRLVLAHVDLSPSTSLSEVSTAEMVVAAFKTTSRPRAECGLESELELVEEKGSFFIPRVLAEEVFDEELNAHSEAPVAIEGCLAGQKEGIMLMRSNEGLEHWVADSEALSPLGDEEVEVRTTHLALCGADLDSVSGAWLESAGRAASGVVTGVGASVCDFVVGTEVYFPILGGKSFRTRIRQQQTMMSKVQGINLAEAASLPTAFLTAQYCLTDVARVEAGQGVLVHLIASAECQAFVQLAHVFGAEVFVTVNSIAERSLLSGRYKIPEHHIFEAASKDLARSLSTATDGKGFDVIINDHEGVALRQASMCLAELGRFIDISGKVRASDLSTDIFQNNISLSTVDIQKLSQSKFQKLFQETAKLLQKRPVVARSPAPEVFSISSLDFAREFLASNPGSSAVVSFDEDSLVPILPDKPSPLALDSAATYLIAGGLGALGLTIAENMVEHGARHLLLLSRSGVTNNRQRDIVKRLRCRGCVVDTPLCDVTDEVQIKNVMSLSREKNWNIRGLIQCAMVLRDSIFENMTFEKWLGATQPKIKGTWNLHKHLPDNLDFFIVLSSMSGIIGNAAQANYAAGNTYEDAVAHYRNARGLKATTLNVGLVADASHFSADSTIEDYLKRYGHWASALVTDREMQITLEAVMRGKTADGGAVPVQLLVGINGEVPRGEDGLNPWSKDRKFDHRVQKLVTSLSGAGSSKSLAEQLKSATTGREAVAIVEFGLRTYVAAAMTASPEEIDAENPLYSFGIDSLKAIQVRNWVFKELKCDVSVFDILSPVPVGQLASSIARKSSLISAEVLAMIEQEGL